MSQDDVTLLALGRSSRMAGTLLPRWPSPPFLVWRNASPSAATSSMWGWGSAKWPPPFPGSAGGPCGRHRSVRRGLGTGEAAGGRRDTRRPAELGLQAVEELDDVRFDLAWLPTPFIPAAVVATGAANIRAAVRPGGWPMVGSTRLDGDPGVPCGESVADDPRRRHATDGDEVSGLLEGAALRRFIACPVPPAAPMTLHAARRTLGQPEVRRN